VAIEAAARAALDPLAQSPAPASLTVQIDTPWKGELSILSQPTDKVKDVLGKAFERSSLKEPGMLPSDVVLRLHGSDVDLYDEEVLEDLPRIERGEVKGTLYWCIVVVYTTLVCINSLLYPHCVIHPSILLSSPLFSLSQEKFVLFDMLRRPPLDPDVLLEASVFPMAMRGAECMAGPSIPPALRLPVATVPKWSSPYGYSFRLIQATGLRANRFCPLQWVDTKSPAAKRAFPLGTLGFLRPPAGSRVVVEAAVAHCGVWLCPPVVSRQVPWSTELGFFTRFDFGIRVADLPATARIVLGVYLIAPGGNEPVCLGSVNWLPVDHRRVLKTGVWRLPLWTEKDLSLFDVPYGPPSPTAPEVIIEIDSHEAPVVFPLFVAEESLRRPGEAEAGSSEEGERSEAQYMLETLNEILQVIITPLYI